MIDLGDLESKQPSIPELEAQKKKIHEVFSKADAAVHHGKATQAQRDALLTHYYGTASEREAVAKIIEQIEDLRCDFTTAPRATALIVGFCAVMLSLFSVLFMSTGGITAAVVGVTDNTPPALIQSIPDFIGQTVEVDLSQYFSDNNELLYESTDHKEVTETIQGSTFIVTGLPGTYTYIVYASDLAERTPSNIFSVTIEQKN